METARSADGTSIAYERHGTGPALVVVAGALCDRRSFGPLAEQLAGDFTVYLYDRRGRGDSGDTAPYSVDREIDDLAAVVAAAGGSALVFGHSSGAALALAAAAAGVPITGLAAYEPPYSVEAGGPDEVEFSRELDALVAAGRPGDAAKLFLGRAGMPAEALAGLEQSPWWAATVAVAHTLPFDVALVGNDGLPRDLLAAVAVPTLVMAGGDSPGWFRDTVGAVAAAVPRARVALLPGQDHNPAEQVLAPALVDFFAH